MEDDFNKSEEEELEVPDVVAKGEDALDSEVESLDELEENEEDVEEESFDDQEEDDR